MGAKEGGSRGRPMKGKLEVGTERGSWRAKWVKGGWGWGDGWGSQSVTNEGPRGQRRYCLGLRGAKGNERSRGVKRGLGDRIGMIWIDYTWKIGKIVMNMMKLKNRDEYDENRVWSQKSWWIWWNSKWVLWPRTKRVVVKNLISRPSRRIQKWRTIDFESLKPKFSFGILPISGLLRPKKLLACEITNKSVKRGTFFSNLLL